MHRTLLLAAAALAPAAALSPAPAQAAAPQVLTAPGRVAIAVPPTLAQDIDAPGATDAVAADGGRVVALVRSSYGQGFSVLALGADGRPDPAFGTDGVVRPPSAFEITVGSPPSRTAMHELVVPRSMPMTLPIVCTCSCSGT